VKGTVMHKKSSKRQSNNNLVVDSRFKWGGEGGKSMNRFNVIADENCSLLGVVGLREPDQLEELKEGGVTRML